MSLARRHRERMLAQDAAGQVASAGELRAGPAATEEALMRARLGVDLRRLSEIQSIERKIELKHELLPEYAAWVEGVLASDAGAPDDVLTHVMIWRIDIGDFDAALPLAAYVVRHDLPLPERFDRTAPTLIAEEIADAALKTLGGNGEVAPDELAGLIAVLERVGDLVDGADIFDQVRAKLEKARGLAAQRAADLIAADGDGPAGLKRALQERALGFLRRALALDTSAGVKKRIEALEREIAKAAAPAD